MAFTVMGFSGPSTRASTPASTSSTPSFGFLHTSRHIEQAKPSISGNALGSGFSRVTEIQPSLSQKRRRDHTGVLSTKLPAFSVIFEDVKVDLLREEAPQSKRVHLHPRMGPPTALFMLRMLLSGTKQLTLQWFGQWQTWACLS